MLGLTQDNVLIYLLTTFRVAGLFAIAPVLGHRLVPVQVRIPLTLLLAYFLFSYTGSVPIELGESLWPLAGLALREFGFGVLLGFLFQILFLGVQFGGGVIGYQIGFALVNVIDPSTSTNVSIISQMKLLIATLVFLLINGHHVVLQALFESFKLVPLGQISLNTLAAEGIVRFAGETFIIGVKLAAPVVVTLFVTDLCLGILARTMPQMNVFIVGFPLKIGVGLFILATTLPLFGYVFTKLFDSTSIEVMQITRGLAG
ncbi:MAG: flagellar biosynthetic protein FliR [bacterium]